MTLSLLSCSDAIRVVKMVVKVSVGIAKLLRKALGERQIEIENAHNNENITLTIEILI